MSFFFWRRVTDPHEMTNWYEHGDGRPYSQALRARNALPAQEKGTLDRDRARGHGLAIMANELYDGRSDRYRAAQVAVEQARVQVMQAAGPHLRLEDREADMIRLLSAEFGMAFPDLPPPPWPRPADYGLTEDVYRDFRGQWRGWRTSRPVPDPSPEELRRLAEFGAARVKAASSHRKADVPGIPDHKLIIDAAMNASRDAWIILDVECAAAVGIWGKLVSENGQAALLGDVAASGLDPGIWTGWLAYLGKAASREGCFHLSGPTSLQGYRHLLTQR